MTLSRDSLLAAVARRTQEEESPIFGGSLLLRELTRAEWRTAYKAAQTEPDETTGEPQILLDVWHAGLFAVGVIGDGGQPLMSVGEVMSFPDRDGYPEEVARVAQLILSLSEQAPDSVKKKSES